MCFLAFWERRLKIAKKLLNPDDSVLIVTIDEKEYLHLGCLLEEMFPDANIQMVSSVIAQNASARKGQFSRNNEFLFFVMFGEAGVTELPLSDEWRANAEDKRALGLRWADLMRNGANGNRNRAPKCFYPIFVSLDGKQFLGAGEPLDKDESIKDYVAPDGMLPIWPIHKDGREGCWGYSREHLLEIQKQGYVKLGALRGDKLRVMYLTSGIQKRVEEGKYEIIGKNEDGSLISNSEYRSLVASTQWNIASHNASRNGAELLKKIIGNRFMFPKSLYAVHDCLRFFVANKKDALIIDFFAGSGTTLNAVNLLNAEDNGHRRCIMVTNNEVSEEEARMLKKQGLRSGDEEWERLGIAHYVTWPRTVCSIKGNDINGNSIKGNYLGSDIPMADGFRANAAFFKLGFLDKTRVALGMQFKELLPLLWMKAGAIGPCPAIDLGVPNMLMLPENKIAILNDENCFAQFLEKLEEYPEIETVYLITDYENSFISMTQSLPGRQTYQLYRDYLDNFRINAGRNSR